MLPERAEVIDDFGAFGILAFTTARQAGSFGLQSAEPVKMVMERWSALRTSLAAQAQRLASASQVHGCRVIVHAGDWDGWLRVDAADGHATVAQGTAMAVTIDRSGSDARAGASQRLSAATSSGKSVRGTTAFHGASTNVR